MTALKVSVGFTTLAAIMFFVVLAVMDTREGTKAYWDGARKDCLDRGGLVLEHPKPSSPTKISCLSPKK